MADQTGYCEVAGIQALLVENPMWPSSANVFLVPDLDGFSLIDVGCGGMAAADRLLAGLARFGHNLDDLHTVVLSHAHPDHMGALAWILESARPRVLIHPRDRASALDPENLTDSFDIPLARRASGQGPLSDLARGFDLLRFFEQSGCAMCAAAEVEEMAEGEEIRLGALRFEVFHTPGHAPGHVSFFEPDRKILLAGDVVGQVPAWYTPSSGGVIGYLRSLAVLETLPAETVLPSHGPIFHDLAEAVGRIRGKLLRREQRTLQLLGRGPMRFMDLVEALFEAPFMRFFPGVGITESHLLKLEQEGRIERIDERIRLVG